jgi:hypothetical protein
VKLISSLEIYAVGIQYVDMANNRGGVFKTVDGKCEGPWQVDSHPMVMKGEVYSCTIRTIEYVDW